LGNTKTIFEFAPVTTIELPQTQAYRAHHISGDSKMPRLVTKLVAGLAALAVFAGTADADSFKVFRKRRGFFETLFGGRSNSEPQLYINSNGEIVTFRKPKCNLWL
jgi:hypothetical protein